MTRSTQQAAPSPARRAWVRPEAPPPAGDTPPGPRPKPLTRHPRPDGAPAHAPSPRESAAPAGPRALCPRLSPHSPQRPAPHNPPARPQTRARPGSVNGAPAHRPGAAHTVNAALACWAPPAPPDSREAHTTPGRLSPQISQLLLVLLPGDLSSSIPFLEQLLRRIIRAPLARAEALGEPRDEVDTSRDDHDPEDPHSAHPPASSVHGHLSSPGRPARHPDGAEALSSHPNRGRRGWASPPALASDQKPAPAKASAPPRSLHRGSQTERPRPLLLSRLERSFLVSIQGVDHAITPSTQ